MKKAYILRKITFDSLENNSSDARIFKELGVVIADKDEVELDLKKLNSQFGGSYRGWDGEAYPQYIAVEASQTSMDDIILSEKRSVILRDMDLEIEKEAGIYVSDFNLMGKYLNEDAIERIVSNFKEKYNTDITLGIHEISDMTLEKFISYLDGILIVNSDD